LPLFIASPTSVIISVLTLATVLGFPPALRSLLLSLCSWSLLFALRLFCPGLFCPRLWLLPLLAGFRSPLLRSNMDRG
jgi:hypothetical protein